MMICRRTEADQGTLMKTVICQQLDKERSEESKFVKHTAKNSCAILHITWKGTLP
jgi:hypothetical protein